jgi:hypothetical protein
MKPNCSYCAAAAKLVTGAEIYPHRPDLAALQFWQCKPCDAFVGCHKAGSGYGDGTRPLGRLANAALRKAKMRAHAAFDPLWKTRQMGRRNAYALLAQKLGIPVDRAHIGEFDEAMCARVVEVCKTPNARVQPLP